MATSKSNAPMNLDYKHHNIIKTFTSLPVHILLKLYQFGVWVVMVWILTQYYTVFGDTVSLFLLGYLAKTIDRKLRLSTP